MGRTTLLSDFCTAALAQGWALIVGDPTGRIAIDRLTRRRGFRDTVLAGMERVKEKPAVSADRFQLDVSPVHEESLVDELSRRAPVLLAIDDYRPSQEFADWFEKRFAPGVLASRERVVTVVAPRRGSKRLESVATDLLKLGPLDRELVRQVLETTLEKLDPAATKKELDRYVKAAKSPVVLASLIRVLSLSRLPEISS
jgi:hypothetical protein